MTERLGDPGQNQTAEDIATLYSRADVQGSIYRDFSQSRKAVRGQFRHQVLREQAERNGVDQKTLQKTLRDTLDDDRAQVAAAHHESTGGDGGAEPGPRWYAMQSVFEAVKSANEGTPARGGQQVSVLAVVSLAGGVGKTCLVATLGRMLSALGEPVLLADSDADGLLPFYFGSRDRTPGLIRTFSPPGPDSKAPVHILSSSPERTAAESDQDDPMLEELLRNRCRAKYILVDVPTASHEVTSRLLPLRPMVLVPILPDMSSVARLAAVEGLLGNVPGPSEAMFLLNQFDASSRLHLDVHAMLRQQLGNRLLPFVLHRSSAISEALAEGMTVLDYQPGSDVAEDYRKLANWLRGCAAPAAAEYAGMRWRER